MAAGSLASLVQSVVQEHPAKALLLSCLVVPILYIIINEVLRNNARIHGLGGPKGLPLIGNLWQIRTNAPEKYRQWSRQYGGVYQIQLGNIPIVVVNTAAAAKVIFGQHSQALSSRPEFYTFHKVSTTYSYPNVATDMLSGSL
jgi:3-hydroxyphenylacetate 6-hydroxylase